MTDQLLHKTEVLGDEIRCNIDARYRSTTAFVWVARPSLSFSFCLFLFQLCVWVSTFYKQKDAPAVQSCSKAVSTMSGDVCKEVTQSRRKVRPESLPAARKIFDWGKAAEQSGRDYGRSW